MIGAETSETSGSLPLPLRRATRGRRPGPRAAARASGLFPALAQWHLSKFDVTDDDEQEARVDFERAAALAFIDADAIGRSLDVSWQSAEDELDRQLRQPLLRRMMERAVLP